MNKFFYFFIFVFCLLFSFSVLAGFNPRAINSESKAWYSYGYDNSHTFFNSNNADVNNWFLYEDYEIGNDEIEPRSFYINNNYYIMIVDTGDIIKIRNYTSTFMTLSNANVDSQIFVYKELNGNNVSLIYINDTYLSSSGFNGTDYYDNINIALDGTSTFFSSPTCTDINNIPYCYTMYSKTTNTTLFRINMNTGEIITNSVSIVSDDGYDISSYKFNIPLISDIDNDNNEEIIVSHNGNISIFDNALNFIRTNNLAGYGGNRLRLPIMIADLNNDEIKEIIYGTTKQTTGNNGNNRIAVCNYLLTELFSIELDTNYYFGISNGFLQGYTLTADRDINSPIPSGNIDILACGNRNDTSINSAVALLIESDGTVRNVGHSVYNTNYYTYGNGQNIGCISFDGEDISAYEFDTWNILNSRGVYDWVINSSNIEFTTHSDNEEPSSSKGVGIVTDYNNDGLLEYVFVDDGHTYIYQSSIVNLPPVFNGINKDTGSPICPETTVTFLCDISEPEDEQVICGVDCYGNGSIEWNKDSFSSQYNVHDVTCNWYNSEIGNTYDVKLYVSSSSNPFVTTYELRTFRPLADTTYIVSNNSLCNRAGEGGSIDVTDETITTTTTNDLTTIGKTLCGIFDSCSVSGKLFLAVILIIIITVATFSATSNVMITVIIDVFLLIIFAMPSFGLIPSWLIIIFMLMCVGVMLIIGRGFFIGGSVGK